MQIELHPSAQETSSGNGFLYSEPSLRPKLLIVSVSQISVNLLGNVVIKVQHSYDGTNWIDIPNLTTGGLTATGTLAIGLSSIFDAADNLRVVWTFSNANSVTFSAAVIGAK